MQRGARNFAKGNTDGLSGGVDMPQGRVPAVAEAATIGLSLDRGDYEGSPNLDTASQTWGIRGAWGLSLGSEGKVGSFPAVGDHE